MKTVYELEPYLYGGEIIGKTLYEEFGLTHHCKVMGFHMIYSITELGLVNEFAIITPTTRLDNWRENRYMVDLIGKCGKNESLHVLFNHNYLLFYSWNFNEIITWVNT